MSQHYQWLVLVYKTSGDPVYSFSPLFLLYKVLYNNSILFGNPSPYTPSSLKDLSCATRYLVLWSCQSLPSQYSDCLISPGFTLSSSPFYVLEHCRCSWWLAWSIVSFYYGYFDFPITVTMYYILPISWRYCSFPFCSDLLLGKTIVFSLPLLFVWAIPGNSSLSSKPPRLVQPSVIFIPLCPIILIGWHISSHWVLYAIWVCGRILQTVDGKAKISIMPTGYVMGWLWPTSHINSCLGSVIDIARLSSLVEVWAVDIWCQYTIYSCGLTSNSILSWEAQM